MYDWGGSQFFGFHLVVLKECCCGAQTCLPRIQIPVHGTHHLFQLLHLLRFPPVSCNAQIHLATVQPEIACHIGKSQIVEPAGTKSKAIETTSNSCSDTGKETHGLVFTRQESESVSYTCPLHLYNSCITACQHFMLSIIGLIIQNLGQHFFLLRTQQY